VPGDRRGPPPEATTSGADRDMLRSDIGIFAPRCLSYPLGRGGSSSCPQLVATGFPLTSPSLDRLIRHRIYSALAQGAPGPTTSTLAAALGVPARDVRESLERLHAAHLLVLDVETREVRMAPPFSNVPSAYHVEGQDTSRNANCAWDALALTRLLRLREARIVDQGGDGREGRVLNVAEGELVERDGVISVPWPAWRWWEDIVFT
jgi:hypothetical protein